MVGSGVVKICGLSTRETLQAALDAGADMVGFVRFPRSPRHVELDAARDLCALAKGRALVVALTVDADDAELAAIVEDMAPDMLQLHGRESPERVAEIRALFGVPVMKATGVAERADLDALAPYARVTDRLLLDAKPPRGADALPGGNGLSFDWRLIEGLAERLDPPVPFMLSGGLSPENVGEAIALTRVSGIDVSSGVESAPGVKDSARIFAFVEAARAAWARAV
ncbi:MAG: phosphoribosylanthranilate isomerase [Salinarimonadaceae bacterium]|nr:MAG: phosphoribosylanthranilate isomerase [Salinarimonadaceae bacterium]